MNDLIPFDYEGTNFRALQDSAGEPWFVAADVATILGYRMASDMTRRLDDDEKGTRSVRTPGGDQDMTVISEAGLYSAVLGSKIPEAKAFKRWVTHEVLPAIRRHGVYATPDTVEAMLQDPDTMIATLTALKTEREARQALQARIAADAPHTRFGRAIASSDGELLVKQVADLITQGGYPISQITLFKWLRAKGWLCKNAGNLWNAPTKWALEKGYVRSSPLVISTSHGDKEKTTPKITAAGQEVLVDGFLTGRFTTEEAAA